jgi:hypothetical protein
LKHYLLNRLAEASTWRGFVMLITALGISLNEAQATAIISAGITLVGLIAVFIPDKTRKPEQ